MTNTRAPALVSRFDHPRTLWLGAGLSLVLLAPSLWGGLMLDDHVLALAVRGQTGIAGLASRPLDLFVFTTGQPQDNRALIDEGVLLPWWAHEQHRNALLRPLSTLTHRLDLWLWPDVPAAMHAHSLLWFGLLLLATWRLYGAICGSDGSSATSSGLGAIAFLVFALDDTRAPTVAWIANRNAILAMLFGVLALLWHHRHRQGEGFRWAPLAWLSTALALASAESGLTIYAYLCAHALWLDRKRGSLAPWLSLVPYGVIAIIWRALYELGGYGTRGSDVYLDPVQQPAAFLDALVHNLPALSASQFGPSIPFADLMLWGPPEWRPAVLFASLLMLGLSLAVFARWLPMDREQRFWALGATLALVPLSASAVGDRLLMPAALGGSALVAHLLVALHERARTSRSRGGLAARPMFAVVAAIHLLAAPLMLPVRAAGVSALGNAVARADRGIPTTPDITERTVVIVNAPVDVVVSYLQISRQARGVPRPRQIHWLATASSSLELQRTGPRTLRVDKPRGWMYGLPERHYRSGGLPLPPGIALLGDTRAEVLNTTDDGRPSQVEFTFDAPLEAPRYLFMVWRDGALVPWPLPQVGERAHFGPHNLFEVLASAPAADPPEESSSALLSL